MIAYKSNPDGCVCPDLRGSRTCIECYNSQCNDKNQWTGSRTCWDAQCLVLDEEHSDPCYRSYAYKGTPR